MLTKAIPDVAILAVRWLGEKSSATNYVYMCGQSSTSVISVIDCFSYFII